MTYTKPRKARIHNNKYFIYIILIFMGIFWGNQALSATIVAEERQVKAVYLFNTVRLIQWPKNLAGRSFRLCVLGEDFFGKWLDVVVHGEKIAGKPIVTPRLRSTEDARNCHTVFITESEKHRLGEILSHLPDGILTVSDTEAFARQGGMIEFYVNRERQIRLAIDPGILEAHGLNASAKLLKIATIVNKDKR